MTKIYSAFTIDLFSLFVFVSPLGVPGELVPLSFHMRRYALELDKIWKKQFFRVADHMTWIGETELTS